ncbi:MAG TPA: hypothetical protein C5S50_11570 [Methanosarcinaceae archaeon]|nr:hypothetical protein [Methanosarcinaceae archaeon]
MNNFNEKVSFIWSVADLLRGPYRSNQYKDVMLPLTVLRRLDCVFEPTKDEVIKKYKSLENSKITNPEKILNRVAAQTFHNTSPFTFEKLKDGPDHIAANLTQYIKSFSNHAREVLPHVPDARVDESKTKIGYEINFNRYFYKYTPPRPLEEIEGELKGIEKEIAEILEEMV